LLISVKMSSGVMEYLREWEPVSRPPRPSRPPV
jgi:hypothetical protein